MVIETFSEIGKRMDELLLMEKTNEEKIENLQERMDKISDPNWITEKNNFTMKMIVAKHDELRSVLDYFLRYKIGFDGEFIKNCKIRCRCRKLFQFDPVDGKLTCPHCGEVYDIATQSKIMIFKECKKDICPMIEQRNKCEFPYPRCIYYDTKITRCTYPYAHRSFKDEE